MTPFFKMVDILLATKIYRLLIMSAGCAGNVNPEPQDHRRPSPLARSSDLSSLVKLAELLISVILQACIFIHLWHLSCLCSLTILIGFHTPCPAALRQGLNTTKQKQVVTDIRVWQA